MRVGDEHDVELGPERRVRRARRCVSAGPTRSRRMGSVSTRTPSISMRTVAWPTKVTRASGCVAHDASIAERQAAGIGGTIAAWSPRRRFAALPRCCCMTTSMAGSARHRHRAGPRDRLSRPPHRGPRTSWARGSAPAPTAARWSSIWRASPTPSGVMQTPDAIARVAVRVRPGPRRRRRRLRRGALCARALDAGRALARRGHGGLARWFRDAACVRLRLRRQSHRHPRHRHGHAPVRTLGRDRRALGPLPRPGHGRLRHRGPRGRLPAEPPPRCLPAHPSRELPHHHPRRRGLRAALDLGGAAVVWRRTARPRRAHRRRHHRHSGR